MKVQKGKSLKIQNLQVIFNEIQICDAKKYSENLNVSISILKKKNALSIILPIIYSILLCKKSPIPAKIVLFIKRISEELITTEEGSATVFALFEHLLSLIGSKTTRVRKNSIFLMTMLSSLNPINEKINNEILEKISERLFDKEKSVRKEAILFIHKYQNFDLNESTKIINIFKNLCRYDPSNECRKLAFENLEVNIFTYNCIIDRCSDTNLQIRTAFYKKFLDKINIRDLRQDKKIFLLKKVFTEREIESIELFVNCCILYYDLPTEFPLLMIDFYHPSTHKILEKLVKRLLNLFDCDISGEKILEEPTYGNLLFYSIYLAHIEDSKGKDDLNLIELSRYVDFIYNYIKNSEENNEKIEICKILFSILNFYDVFDDESKKIISSTIYKLIKSGAPEEILESVVKIMYKIDPASGDKMFGALIHKHMDSNSKYSLQICKYLLKYSISIDKIQEAIVNEIILNYKDGDLETDRLIAECTFFYLNIDPNEKVFETFVLYKDRCETFFKMAVDLALRFKDTKYKELSIELLKNEVESENVSVLIPASKLIISQALTDESLILQYVKFALSFYFNEEDDHIQQYLNVFFHEYFLEDSSLLLEAFCPVYENLERNEKYFVDRILYLIENSKKAHGTQTLFYKICINFYIFYSESKHIKKFLYVLSRINIVGAWDPILTKKILFCCTQLMKKSTISKKFTEFANTLMSIDDGEPISQDDLRIVKQDLCMS